MMNNERKRGKGWKRIFIVVDSNQDVPVVVGDTAEVVEHIAVLEVVERIAVWVVERIAAQVAEHIALIVGGKFDLLVVELQVQELGL